jgi:hypothetical protein
MNDASIVYITRLTMAPPDRLVFHTARGWTKTYCGRRLDSGQPEWRPLLVSCRRDTAELVANLCRLCARFSGEPLE